MTPARSPARPGRIGARAASIALATALACNCLPAAARCAADLRLMTFNIRLDTTDDGSNAWPHRRAFFSGQIALLRPDILGLQEVLASQKRDLEADLPGYSFLGVGRDDGVAAGEFSSLAVRTRDFAILSSGTFWLSPTPAVPSLGWDAAYRRVATWAHLRRRSDGMRVLALNSHWDNAGALARLEGAREIRNWIAAHRRPGERLAVMGDFNAPAGTPELDALAEGGMLADSRAAGSIGSTATFNGFSATPEKAQAIDHVFVGGGLVPLRHAVISWTADGRVASDHFAVVADAAPSAGHCADQ